MNIDIYLGDKKLTNIEFVYMADANKFFKEKGIVGSCSFGDEIDSAAYNIRAVKMRVNGGMKIVFYNEKNAEMVGDAVTKIFRSFGVNLGLSTIQEVDESEGGGEKSSASSSSKPRRGGGAGGGAGADEMVVATIISEPEVSYVAVKKDSGDKLPFAKRIEGERDLSLSERKGLEQGYYGFY